MSFTGIEAETTSAGQTAIVLGPISPNAGEIEIVFSTTTDGGAWTVVNDPDEWHEVYTSGDQKMHVWVRKRTATSKQPWFTCPSGATTGCGGYVRYTSTYTGWLVSGAVSATAPSINAPVAGTAARVFASTGGNLFAPAGETDVNPRSGVGTAGVIYGSMITDDTGLNPGSSSGTVTAGFSSGAVVYAVTVAMFVNQPPNAPAWASPADGASLDVATGNDLTYLFSDPDVYDSQSGRDYFTSTDGGATWAEIDQRTDTTQTITLAAGTFTAGQAVQVQVRAYDKAGAVSARSPSLHLNFIANAAPPTFTNLTRSDTITSSSQLVEIAIADATQFRWQVLGDNGSGAADPTRVIDPETTVPYSGVLSFTATNLPTGQTVHIQAAGYVNGLWTDYADLAIPVLYTAPVLPVLTLTEDPVNGRITVTLATAAPGAGQVAAVSASLEARPVDTQITDWSRSGAAVALNGDTIHANPASGIDYEYRVTSVAASGATTVGSWIGSATGTPVDESPFLSGGTPADPNGVLL